jgi:hypothetical protein
MPVFATIPSQIVAGTSVRVLRRFEGYSPLDSWTYQLIIAGGGKKPLAIDGVANGDSFGAEITPEQSATFSPGAYAFSERVLDSAAGELVEVGSGSITVLGNLADAKIDPRSHPRRVLDAIEAVIERRATVDQESYQIGGRALSRTPISELLVLRDRYKEEVRQEDAAKAGRDPRNVGVRFSRV